MELEVVWSGATWREIQPPPAEPETAVVQSRRAKQVRRAQLRRLSALARGRAGVAGRARARATTAILAALGTCEADATTIQREVGLGIGVVRGYLRELVRSGVLDTRNEKVKRSTTYRKLYRRRQARTEAA